MKNRTWKDIPTPMDLEKLSLEELILLAESLFPHFRKPRLTCYNFTIGYFPYGYVFNVVNSWQNWNKKNYITKFGAYKDIRDCVIEFLKYVKTNKINIRDLWEK